MRKTSVFGGPNFGVEKRVHASQLHELSEGTIDNFIYDARNRNLYVNDFKHGHDTVEVFECWQLINYIAGIITLLGFNGLDDQTITCYIRIVQPRAFHRDGVIREWKIKLSSLRVYFNILKANIHQALSSNATLRTGDHCKHCCARHACEPALKAATS